MVLRRLREREAACRGEAERLRGEAERIAELLRVCEEESVGLSTACQVVGELPMVHALVAPARPQVPAPRTESVGGRAQVKDAAAVMTEQMLGVLAGHAGPVRCRRVVEGLGLEATARNVERVRHHLKKAAAGGWCRRPGVCSPSRVPRSRRAGDVAYAERSSPCWSG
jgi:hypothetical protein